MRSPHLVWLDCDPGHNSNVTLLGISTTHGNQDHHKITRNAALVLKASGLDHLRIVPGQTKPLNRPSLICPGIHGETGLDGTFALPPFDPSLILENEKAVLYLAKLLETMDDHKVTLIATGPLTNYSLLLTLYPELHCKIKQIIFMGGSIGSGNWTPSAEFNILVDPEAASIVVQSGVPVTMVPLEVTHQAIVTDKVIQELESRLEKSPFCTLVVELLLFFKKTYQEVFDFNDGPPLHDPTAVAFVTSPELFTSKEMGVHVVTADGPCLGQTVCDIYSKTEYSKINVATNIDVNGFMSLMIDALYQANMISSMNTKH